MASRKLADAGTQMHASKSRRTTCDICRERKVRCDKEQPLCERCKRLDLVCSYTPISDSRDVSQTLSYLQARLAKAESIINAMTPTSLQSPSQSTDYPPAPVCVEGQDSPSSCLLLDSSDVALGYFPNIEQSYLSSDFVGSWAVNADKINKEANMPESLLQLSDLGTSESGAIQIPLPAAPQKQSVFKLRQQEKLPFTSIPSYDIRAPPLSSIDLSPVSVLWTDRSPVGQDIMSLLHQRYFESIRTEINAVDPERFFKLLLEKPVRHQVNALSYAIAIFGASLGDDFSDLKSFIYESARQYLELAERQEDGSSFLNLESLQALLLILWYDFSDAKCIQRAHMTHARAMRLAKLLRMDTIDAGQVPAEVNRLFAPHTLLPTFAAVNERRRTFWFAFSADFFISALTDTLPTLEASEILTYLPSSVEARTEGPSRGVFLDDAIAHPSSHTLYKINPLIIATALGNKALHHVKLSMEQNSFSAYDFWTHHYRLDKATLVQLALYPSPRKNTSRRDYVLLLTTYLTLLGVSILIHMKAFERAREAGFPEGVATTSRQRFETLAMEISETCRGGGEFSYLTSHNFVCMYLIWPICLAAKAQLLSIKNPNPNPNIDHKSTHFTSEESLYTSLRALESVLNLLGITTTYSGETLEEIRLVLEKNGDYSASCWSNMLI